MERARRPAAPGAGHLAAARRPPPRRAPAGDPRARRADRPRRGYLDALLRAQLRLATAILLGIAVPIAGLPALFALVPATRAVHVGPVPLPWVVVGVLLYPVVVVAARIYVRQSERVEREFAELMGQR